MSTRTRSRTAARKVQDSRGLEVLVRAGYAASGLIHLLLGYLAIQVAFHRGGESDQSGAFTQIAKLPVGGAILWITVVGMFALALWLLIQAVLGIGSSSRKRWSRSLVSAGKAVAYGALGATALTFAQGGRSSSTSSTRRASSSCPPGREGSCCSAWSASAPWRSAPTSSRRACGSGSPGTSPCRAAAPAAP
jgi:hypothetical protein